MKIISLNVNQFCGCLDWTKDIKIELRKTKMDKIIEYISEQIMSENDICICHEVPSRFNNRELYDKFITTLENKKYIVITPNYWNKRHRKPFITCAVVLKESKWKVSNENFICSWFDSYKYENRMIMLENTDSSKKILGVHIPMVSSQPAGSVMWDDIKYMYKIDNSILVIGDMNVYVDGTIQKRKYNEFIELGACDIWIEKGGKHNRITYKKGEIESRLDYAFASKQVCEKVRSIEILDEPREKEDSDHSALLIELI